MTDSSPRPPLVSVIVPAWNVAPWLQQCLRSVEDQTIGTDNVELIVVDDGSTDGTGDLLDAFAAERSWVRVHHQANSGGPGGPRNVGMDMARAPYVLFLDGDDYLGPEALARLVAMAERNTSDVVVVRIVGVEGRPLSRSMAFDRDVDRADLLMVSGSGNVLKLFRRSTLEASSLRFVAGVPGGEDGDFMQRAYLAASVISIVGSYPCYYARRRPGSQTTRHDRVDDIGEKILRVEQNRIVPVAERFGPGLRRDVLLAGHLGRISHVFRTQWLAQPPEERERVFRIGSGIAQRWLTDRMWHLMAPKASIRLYCLAHGLQAELEAIAAAKVDQVYDHPRIEDGRIYAAYPHFRDGSGIPDSCFDLTPYARLVETLDRVELGDGRLHLEGTAYLRFLGGTPWVALRGWPIGPVHRVPVTVVPTPLLRDGTRHYPQAGFTATIELATALGGKPLPPGSWEIMVGAGIDEGFERSAAAHLPRAVRRTVRTSSRMARFGRARGRRLVLRSHGRVHLLTGPAPAPVVALEELAVVWRRVTAVAWRTANRLLQRTGPGRQVLAVLHRRRGSTRIRAGRTVGAPPASRSG